MGQFWLAYFLFLSICSEGHTATIRQDAATLLEKANTEYRSSHFPAAIDLYREYLARYPDRPDVRVYLGAALLSASETDAAFVEAKRAIQLDDHYAKAYALEGRIYSAGQDWDLAEQCFAKALSLDPQDRETGYSCSSKDVAQRASPSCNVLSLWRRIRWRCVSSSVGFFTMLKTLNRLHRYSRARWLRMSAGCTTYWPEFSSIKARGRKQTRN
jgi:tetratricopeptide (TPR) repeat protein